LILSGTGSCCFGRSTAGKTAKIGGWGHLLGDQGSGYEIGLRAIKEVIFYFDRDGKLPRLGRQILQRLQMNEPLELIAWAQGADKSQIASVAMEVFDSWNRGDQIAGTILADAAKSLAEDGLACAQKLTGSRNAQVQFILAGSVLLKQPKFARAVGKRLREEWPGALIQPLKRESAWGAVELARIFHKKVPSGFGKMRSPSPPSFFRGRGGRFSRRQVQGLIARISDSASSLPEMPISQLGKISPTEQRNPRSLKLDKMAIAEAVELMLSEDAKIPAAVRAEAKQIARAVKLIAQAFQGGGRLFYVGAGTSGRLGVLDASECPPTFRTPPELVQGIIAGGPGALWKSVEGAEDDAAAGARAIEFRNLTRRDVVVGISASGRAPFVWGALVEAKARGARTILLAFNPYLTIPPGARPSLVISPNLGPEILTGSTRLKAGTATKLILNMFTTLAMVRIGKVISNLMVDLNPSNTKLRDRAVRIVQELRGVDYATAEAALKRSNWVIKKACARLKAD
jgi:N-acetylmuramic acid 6-phosphate etherase